MACTESVDWRIQAAAILSQWAVDKADRSARDIKFGEQYVIAVYFRRRAVYQWRSLIFQFGMRIRIHTVDP